MLNFRSYNLLCRKKKRKKVAFLAFYLVLSLSPGRCFRLGVTFGLLLASCAGRACAQASAWEGGKTLQVCPSPRVGELELWPTYSHGGVYSSAKTMRDEAHLLLQRGARGVPTQRGAQDKIPHGPQLVAMFLPPTPCTAHTG